MRTSPQRWGAARVEVTGAVTVSGRPRPACSMHCSGRWLGALSDRPGLPGTPVATLSAPGRASALTRPSPNGSTGRRLDPQARPRALGLACAPVWAAVTVPGRPSPTFRPRLRYALGVLSVRSALSVPHWSRDRGHGHRPAAARSPPCGSGPPPRGASFHSARTRFSPLGLSSRGVPWLTGPLEGTGALASPASPRASR